MKVRDLIGPEERHELIDYLVARGMNEEQAKAKIEGDLDVLEWQFNAQTKIKQRILNLMVERGASGTTTASQVISAQELKTIRAEELAAARERARDLN